MKKSKIIIPALAMLVMSTAATVTGTVAWFSMNKTVTAEGMKVRAAGSGSIVITKYTTATGNGFPTATTKSTAVNFWNADATELYPSSHTASGTGLYYVSNGDQVCFETGTQKGSVALTSAAVPENANSLYYKDYDIYIAGDGREFEHQDVTIEWSWDTHGYNHIDEAISIDFYAAELNAGGQVAPNYTSGSENFKGTLNIAELDPVTNNGTATKQSVVIEDVTLGAAGTAALGIKMRVYYDGNLVDQNGTVSGTTYTNCSDSEHVSDYTSNTNLKYFYNSNNDIVYENIAANASESVAGLKFVDLTNSKTTFAKSVDYNDISDVELLLNFTATNH